MKKEIELFQAAMVQAGVDIALVTSGDGHGSEFFADHFKCCPWLSGLTSESQTLVITRDRAFLWTDGRYFLQAERQLEGSGITLMRTGEPGVPSVNSMILSLAEHEDRICTVAFDGKILTADAARSLINKLKPVHAVIRSDLDLTGSVWKDRPPLVPSPVWTLPAYSAGRTCAGKLADVRAEMKRAGVTHLLITDLAECAWLSNLRGSDVAYTPVFLSYALVTQERATLFTMTEFPDDADPLFERAPYGDVYAALSCLTGTDVLWTDGRTCAYELLAAVPDGVTVTDRPTPVELLKAVKNPGEIKCTKKAHIADGISMVKFIYWLKRAAAGERGALSEICGRLTEKSAAEYLRKCRLENPGCFDISFETISAYMENGAIIHYAPSEETDAAIKPLGFLLVDSGGQYLTGTTDVTRTVSVGPLTEYMRTCYTLVLKSHIALAQSVFDEKTSGADLDRAARKPLRDSGFDFLHGISHGVGHVLSVHEGPNLIRRSPDAPAAASVPAHGTPANMASGAAQCVIPTTGPVATSDAAHTKVQYTASELSPEAASKTTHTRIQYTASSAAPDTVPVQIRPGMIQSDEPGIYLAGEFGIRIENELLCVDMGNGKYGFEPLTLCPYEREAIDKSLLSPDEIAFIDNYHELVRNTLTPFLEDYPELLGFLNEAAAPL